MNSIHPQTIRKWRWKTPLIFLSLIVIYIFGFAIKMETRWEGPRSSDAVDDLGICEAYLNRSNNTIVLITPHEWALLDLKPIMATNAQIRLYPIPKKGNFLYWSSFKSGHPSPEQFAGTEKVAIATDKYASFAYKNNGTLWESHEQPVVIPTGYSSALFRGAAEYGEDNRTNFKSYSLATSAQAPDKVQGVAFFFNPGTRMTLSAHWWIGLINPSFIALCIAVPVTFGEAGALISTILFLVAFLLHGVASLLYRWGVAYGEAWSGRGEYHNEPTFYFVTGCFVLFLLIAIKVVRFHHFRSHNE